MRHVMCPLRVLVWALVVVSFPIAAAAYKARGGKDPDLPGRGTVSGAGRADARFSVDADGELYLFSKTDGVIRAVVAAK